MDGPGLFPTSLQPLEGGFSGETFLGETSGETSGEQVVARIYGGRSLARGPLAPEVDAAVLELVRGLLPVPRVLEVRRGDDASGLPGLLLTTRLPGERLDLLLPDLDPARRRQVGAGLGVLLGRLGHLAQPRAGLFVDLGLAPTELPPELRDLPSWVEHHDERLRAVLDPGLVDALGGVVDDVQDLLDEDRRHVLVHGDLNPKNLLVDPDTLEVTGLVDWEFAHAGSPYADLGNLLRLDRDPVLVDAVLGAYRDFMPAVPGDLLDRARSADLFALVDLAVRPESTTVVLAARDVLTAIARAGDVRTGLDARTGRGIDSRGARSLPESQT